MPQSINNIISDVRTRVKDNNASNYYWKNDSTDGYFITSRLNSNLLWLDRTIPYVDTNDIEVTANTYDYPFPTGAFRILTLWLRDNNGVRVELNRYRAFNGRIYFTDVIPQSGTIEVWHTAKRNTIPLVAVQLSGSVASTLSGSIVCTSMSSYPYPSSGVLQMGYEQMTYSSKWDTGFFISERGSNSTTGATQAHESHIYYVPEIEDEYSEVLKLKTIIDLTEVAKQERAKFEQWASQGQFDVNLPQLIAMQSHSQIRLDKLVRETGEGTQTTKLCWVSMIDTDLTYNGITIKGSSGTTEFDYRSTSPYYIVALQQPSMDNTEVRSYEQVKPGEEGIADYEDFLGAEKIVLRLIIKGKSRTYLNNGINAVREAFHPKAVYYATDNDNGYLPLNFTETGQTAIKIDCIPYKLPSVKEVKNQGLTAKIDVFLQAKYPFRKSQTGKSLTLQTAIATGGSGYPLDYPVGYSTPTGSINGDAINSGDLPAIPLVVIHGPAIGSRLENTTTGEFIDFTDDMNIADGVTLTIDFEKATAVDSNGNNQLQNLTSASKFFKIEPGTNTLQWINNNVDGYCVITWNDIYV